MKFERTDVFNFVNALRGMRNPLESWNKSDSYYDNDKHHFELGPNDAKLAKKLIQGGSEHRKFLRQIFVTVDITAPLYWWKEFDTYKVGTVANSTSTMHKLMSKPIDLTCFQHDTFENENLKNAYETTIEICETLRKLYLNNKDTNPEYAYEVWRCLVQLLPESWLQTRTVTMNYEVVRTIYHQRKNHKLSEWSWDFCSWVFDELPYSDVFIVG